MEDLIKRIKRRINKSSIKVSPSSIPYTYIRAVDTREMRRIIDEEVAKESVCHWKYDDSEYYYETECGNLHVFTTGTPKDNYHTFCPYCGNKIVEVE